MSPTMKALNDPSYSSIGRLFAIGYLKGLREGLYTPGEIDRTWSEAIEADFAQWRTSR